jgi:hypothetical protein
MKSLRPISFAVLLTLASPWPAAAAGKYFEVTYPGGPQPGTLHLDVTYSLWIPEGVRQVRAVIVHQHGCGTAANAAGETAAHDLHWQALATKWDAAFLAPHYRQTEQGRDGCELWSDPRQGSQAAFLRSLDDFAAQSGHAEIKSVPWCLWGHSGGAYWVSLMETLAPERIVAAWLRSGTAFPAWESGETAKPDLTAAVYCIPTMLNPGIKESTDGRPIAAWLGSAAMFKAYRAHGAPIAFAADPLSGHDCGDSRYLAIPYFDACLEMRLPTAGVTLKTVDMKQGWLAELMGRKAVPAAQFTGKANVAVWLPNERIGRAWMEYVTTGATTDTTPPPAPTRVTVTDLPDHSVEITWDAAADFESGLRGFLIERDGQTLARVPEQPVGKFGRPLFQTLSFHDTPEAPLPEMRFVDTTVAPGVKHEYRVIAINGVGLESPAAGRSASPSH